MIILSNALSLNMVASFPATIHVKEMPREKAREILMQMGFKSAVGHADTAAVFEAELGLPVKTDRSTISLESGAGMVVGQYRGPRLPEGVKSLPADAVIQWFLVWVL